MKQKLKKATMAILALAMSVCVFLGVGAVARAENAELVSGYGFTSNNTSGTIAQIDDGVRISAKAATTGNIFDYTYNAPLSVTDLNVSYRLTTDTTRENGAHSRMNIYILPEKDSELSAGVKIQLLHSVYDDNEMKFIVTGPAEPSGWDNPAYFTDDYSVEMRIFTEGSNAFAVFNGARYQFNNGDDIGKIFAMQTAGHAYLRFTAHFQENGESALGYDLDIRSIDGVSLGKSTYKDTSFVSTKVTAAAGSTKAITGDGFVISGKFAEGCGTAAKYSLGSEHTIAAGGLSSFGMTMDVSGVDPAVKKYVEISFTNILDNADRIDAWDSLSDAAGQPTILAATYRLFLTPGEVVTAIMKSVSDDGTQGIFGIAGGANALENAPYYKFSSFVPRNDKILTFAVAKVQGDWKILVNGASVGFEADINAIMNKLNDAQLEVSVNLGSDDAANYYASAESVPTDVVKITGVNGKTFVLEPDPYEGDYADEITGETEFVRSQFVNIAPSDTAIVNYAVTEDGLSAFGRNETLGFSAGLCYTEEVEITHDKEFTFTVKMPENVYAANSNKHGYYCFFIGDSTHKNFSEMRSIYLRISYESSEETVKSATTPFKLEAIMWDNQYEALVVADNTVHVGPKTTEGRESEITFRFVYAEKEQVYKIYVNGQKVTSAKLEQAITKYIDEVMEKHYFACAFDYSLNTAAGGAWTESDENKIGATIVAFNGKKIVNKQPDMFAAMTLKDGKNVTSDSVTLSWTKGEYTEGDFDSYNFTPTGYKIVRKVKDADSVDVREDKVIYIDDIDTVEYTDTQLLPETSYYYSVYAVQKNEDGTYIELFRSNLNKRVVTLAKQEPGPSESDSGKIDSTSGGASAGDSNTGSSGRGGCFSSMGICGVALTGVLFAAAVIIRKKKQD